MPVIPGLTRSMIEPTGTPRSMRFSVSSLLAAACASSPNSVVPCLSSADGAYEPINRDYGDAITVTMQFIPSFLSTAALVLRGGDCAPRTFRRGREMRLILTGAQCFQIAAMRWRAPPLPRLPAGRQSQAHAPAQGRSRSIRHRARDRAGHGRWTSASPAPSCCARSTSVLQ